MRPAKKLSCTLLLICEGENTEPEYFRRLASIAMTREIYSHVEIYPRPKDKEEEQEKSSVKANIRPKRHFKKGTESVPERLVELADEEEKAFRTLHKGVEIWPTPVRYIKEARDRIKTEEYDEIWAIYDKDGHAGHRQAVELAGLPLLDKTINIAFSSISFEHWILLHFEKNDYPFEKSECKEDKKSILCGTGVHANDCGGYRCVAGVLVGKGYLPSYSKSSDSGLFSKISENTELAIENAAWLNMIQTDKLKANPIWEINPVTTVDVLVKKMLNYNSQIFWIKLTTPLNVEGIEFVINHIEGNFILAVTNNTAGDLISNQFSVAINNAPEKLKLCLHPLSLEELI